MSKQTTSKEKLTLSEKKQRQLQKRKKQSIIGAIALVAVVAIIVGGAVFFANVDPFLRSKTGAQTANRQVNKAVLTYYFNEYLSDYVNERLYYIENGMLNLDLKKDLKDQTYDGTNTWYSYFAGKARDSLRRDVLLCEMAAKDGVTLTEAEQKALDDRTAAINPTDFGRGLQAEDVRTALELQTLAEKYLAQTKSSLYGTEADWEARYEKNTTEYQTVDYLMVEIQPVIGSEAEQKTYDALLEKAMDSKDPTVFADTAEKMLVDHADVDAASAAVQADNLLQASQTYMEDNPISEWLFDAETALYDTYIDETTSSLKMYMITRLVGRDESLTANYMNILVLEEDGGQAQAEALLKQWQDGEATADSFAELAVANSKDSTSLKTGGHYQNVFNGRMAEAVNTWLFDETRKVGDVAVLEANGGYQVVYYEGTGVQRWQISIRTDLYNENYEQLLNDGEKTYSYAINEAALDSIRDKINYEN